MAKITEHLYKDRYAPKQKRNSFYIEQGNDTKIGDEYLTGVPEVIYRINNSGRLCGEETALLW